MRPAMQNARGPEGYALVSTALLLVVLCGFAALAIDIGVFMSVRASAQRAADAAALAGAFTFVSNQSAPQPGTAQNQAMATAGQNVILDRAVAPGEVNVAVNVGARRVTVNVTRTTGSYFARALRIARSPGLSPTPSSAVWGRATPARRARSSSVRAPRRPTHSANWEGS